MLTIAIIALVLFFLVIIGACMRVSGQISRLEEEQEKRLATFRHDIMMAEVNELARHKKKDVTVFPSDPMYLEWSRGKFFPSPANYTVLPINPPKPRLGIFSR